MSMLINFSPELRTWILHNLDRGCSTQELIAAMVAQEFEPSIAEALVGSFAQARATGASIPLASIAIDSPATLDNNEYIYETPRISGEPVIVTADRTIPVILRVAEPVMVVMEAVLSGEECDGLIALAQPRLRPSTVVDFETGNDKVAEHRDSFGMFFELAENPFIAKLDERISRIMNCPVENGEGLQVLHYGPQTKNTPHFDFLVPSNAKNQASIARSGQRVSSLIIYLNDVEAGGETVFPTVGLSIIPKKGNAVYFEYCNSLHQLDHKSLHAGAPVNTGEKWIVTKWMREKSFVPAK